MCISWYTGGKSDTKINKQKRNEQTRQIFSCHKHNADVRLLGYGVQSDTGTNKTDFYIVETACGCASVRDIIQDRQSDAKKKINKKDSFFLS